MPQLSSWFSPAEGLLVVQAPDAPEGEYLIWAEEVLIGRSDAARLRAGEIFSPINRLGIPWVVRAQPVSGGEDSESGVWIRQETGDRRRRLWARGRSPGFRRLTLLATGGWPDEDRLQEVLAEIGERIGEAFFDSVGILLLAEGDAEDFHPQSALDHQGRLDFGGLGASARGRLLERHLQEDPPLICAPLDPQAAAEACRLSDLFPLLFGSWLPEAPDPAASGLRLKASEEARKVGFEIQGRWMDLTTPRSQTDFKTAESLLRLWFGFGSEAAAGDSEARGDLIGRLRKSGAPATILLTPGVTEIDALRELKDARFTSLEMISGGTHRRGLPLEPFSWRALTGRKLVYLEQDPALDDLLAAQCRKLGLAYLSPFLRLAPAGPNSA